MKTNSAIILILILTTLLSCKNNSKSQKIDIEQSDSTLIEQDLILGHNPDEGKFRKVRNLSEYKNTLFIPTLEHQISNENNSVYCATLLLAWDGVRKTLNAPLTVPEQYVDLKLLNESTSYADVLKSNEYKIDPKVEKNRVSVKAELSKLLPFEENLRSFDNKLTFDGEKVASFGLYGDDSKKRQDIVQIIYYKNDNNFILKLLPKDKKHEIILYKTEEKFNSIAEKNVRIAKLTEIGKKERKNEETKWKYEYNSDDVVIIPKFNFNIETSYSDLEKAIFYSEKELYDIEKAWQRTAFILDETGAQVESEAEVIAYLGCDSMEKEPKKMIFDKPFLILLKRTDAANPYFGLWTTNTELMVKE